MRVTAAAESRLRTGHPWLFADSVRGSNRPGRLGELAVIFDRHDRFLAIGLFDPDSPLRVRVLHAGKPQTLDAPWWRTRLRTALERRAGLFDAQTTGYRLIHGENDRWPGLVLDRYAATGVLKIYTAAWLPRLGLDDAPPADAVLPLLHAELPELETFVLRLSRNLQTLARERFGLTDGQVLSGRDSAPNVRFLETGLTFEADVRRGQKTGFFLDQRENRLRIGTLARGRAVLNVFSFSGAFSVYAARGGATSTTDLDLSPHALESAARNLALNRHLPTVAACHHERVQADAFAWLAQHPSRLFDLIVLDPPSLARRESERPGAIQAYGRLVASSLRWLAPGGVLLAASCSAHVSADEFFGTVRTALRGTGRRFTELETTGHPPDHLATFPEAHYLKAIYLRCEGLTPPGQTRPSRRRPTR
ncbi:MAG: class I SAM-dependent methyltransferase [Verrucomicrobiales bacterium]|nr:class I SAM-dependent methyltransferase [Verrucomicrobiales bacterium]